MNPRVGDHLVAGVFAKVNLTSYKDIVTSGSFGPDAVPDKGIDYFQGRTEADLMFIEPGLFVKGGFKKFKGIVQVSPLINAGGELIRYNWLSLNLGLTMKLGLTR